MLFEYAILLEEKRDREDEVTEQSRVLVPITSAVAKDLKQAQMIAARAIPDEYATPDLLDRIQVAVRPF